MSQSLNYALLVIVGYIGQGLAFIQIQNINSFRLLTLQVKKIVLL